MIGAVGRGCARGGPFSALASGSLFTCPEHKFHDRRIYSDKFSSERASMRQRVDMSGVSDIEELISSMRAELLPDVYVFATTQDESLASAVSAKMTFREAEGLTLILTREEADGLALKHDFPCH